MAHCRLNYKDLHYKEDPGREAEVGKRDALRSVIGALPFLSTRSEALEAVIT